MPLWNIVRVDPATRTEEQLGRVRAKNQPAALLAACRKYGITRNEEQRRIAARPARKVEIAPPLPDDGEMRAVREFLKRISGKAS